MTQTIPAAVHAQSLDTIFRSAHTAVRFTDEPVDPAVVEEIYETFKYGPTAFNSVPLRLKLVQSDSERAELVDLMMAPNQPKTAAAPLLAILSAEANWHHTLAVTAPHMTGAREMFADEGARRQMARMNGALQMGYFIVAARAHGLDVAPMTGVDAAGVQQRFLPASHEFLAVVALGHADHSADRPRSPRLPFEDVVSFS